jgi:hypothetical protein
MRRLFALALVVALIVVMTAAPAAEAAGAATNVALGLASFAVFNSLFVAPFFYPRYAYAVPAPAYYYPAYPTYAIYPGVVQRPYYQTVYVQASPPAPAPRNANVVRYPHGRYELRGDGINTAYQWVWIPNPPPPPPGAPPPPPAQ